MKKGFYIFLWLCVTCITCLHGQTFEYKSHSNAGIAGYTMPYRLFVPSGYDSNTSYPLVLFLHGAGERGTDNNAQLTANRGATLWAENANQAAFPCFVVAPQCPSNAQWVNTNWSNGSFSIDDIPVSSELKMVKDLLETLQTQYNIDATRLYITGISMGGYGTWDFILRYPGMFKAAIPICGAGDPSKASLITTLPLRVFHSSDDPIVPVSGSRDMINAINAQGPNNRNPFYTEYTDQGHFSWVNAYNSSDLVSWLFNASPITLNCNYTQNLTVNIEPASVSMQVNQAKKLLANVAPDDICNNTVTWLSSDPEIVSVDQNGNILSKNGGKAIISATSFQGNITANCEVTVAGKNAKYEAEDAALNGIIVYDNHRNFSGTGFVAPFWVVGDYVEYTIQHAEEGNQNIILRYCNGYAEDRTISLYVNDEKIRQINLVNTSVDWEEWGDRIDSVILKSGQNKIKYQIDSNDNGQLNIDYLLVKTTASTGVKQTSQPDDVYLYIDSNNSDVIIKNVGSGSKIKVASIDGKLILNTTLTNNEIEIDTSNWNRGVYVFIVETAMRTMMKKAII